MIDALGRGAGLEGGAEVCASIVSVAFPGVAVPALAERVGLGGKPGHDSGARSAERRPAWLETIADRLAGRVEQALVRRIVPAVAKEEIARRDDRGLGVVAERLLDLALCALAQLADQRATRLLRLRTLAPGAELRRFLYAVPDVGRSSLKVDLMADPI
jgi:hypothetical protein